MAVNERRDDASKNPTKLFLKDIFERAKTIACGGQYQNPKDGKRNSAFITTGNVLNGISASSLVALGFVAINAVADIHDLREQRDNQFPTDITAIEDVMADQGIAATRDHIAVRLGDEFMIYAAPENKNGTLYTYVPDPKDAVKIAVEYAITYQALSQIQAIEDAYSRDVVSHRDFYETSIEHMSVPYYGDDVLRLRVDSAVTAGEEMSAERLTELSESWAHIARTIIDGGYGEAVIEADYAENDLTLDGFTNTDSYLIAHMLQGYALFGGLCLAGGAAGTALQRRQQKTKRKTDVRASVISKV